MDTKDRILKYAGNRGEFTASDAADYLNVSLSHTSNMLNHLATSGQLVQVVARRNGLPPRFKKQAIGLLSKRWDKSLKL